ncbi:MAG: 2-hydroxychromene-2-carboxylate isomerase/DsbA-like thioredoxin domain protein [Myxococcales bacterium]|nr:2-hydroxychromene-2-carboxylate isomerase/DsbA-like thioredoxin domain protein [Myxococcales bacterium]
MLDWQPFELRPGAPEEGWAIPAHVRAKMGAPDNPLKARAEELGLTLVEREWIPSSRRAHECTEFARAEGRLEPFHAAVLQAYWSEGKDLHEWAVLEAAAAKAGLDAAAMRASVEAGTMRRAVDERVEAAHARNIHAVPTFVVDDRLVIQGAQTLEVFRGAMARLGIEPRQSEPGPD